MKIKKGYVMVCPKCGSERVHNDLSKDMVAWGGSTRYVCNDCDFSSPMFPEVIKSEVKKAKKQIKSKTKSQDLEIKNITKSKGFIHKKFTKWYAIVYIIIIVIAIIYLIYNIVY